MLRDGLGRTKEVQHKNERTSIVTSVDLAAQETIGKVIAERFPDHALLGRGGLGGDHQQAELTWLVDPLDGTSNFAHGLPFACTSVAVRDADGLVAGAILEPFRGELFTAVRGGGAWLGEERLRVSETVSLDRALVCTGVQSDDPAAVAVFAERMERLAAHVPCRALPRFTGAVPGLRRRGTHRRVPRTRLDLRLGRRSGRAHDQ